MRRRLALHRHAKDLEQRLQAHRDGIGSKYVRARLPFTVMHTERKQNRSTASKREAEIKAMTKSRKEELFS